MDRRNGGDPQAPPRPPKSLPRIHRPRAPEPPMMSSPLISVQHQNHENHQQKQQLQLNQQQQEQQQSNQIQCTKSPLNQIRRSDSVRDNNNSVSNTTNCNNSNNINNHISTITTITDVSHNNNLNSHSNNITNISSGGSNSNNRGNNVTIHPAPITVPLVPLHLQQQQHQAFNINSNIINNNNNNNLNSTTNSFTRRRQPPPILNLTLPSISSNILHSTEPPVSPVTLAAPRPESERLANEYVDTPFRTAQQLHNASRHQHPAGQTIHGQTTTQHNLLLLQSQRQQQQQQQQQQQHTTHTSSHHQISNNAIISGTTVPHIRGSDSSTTILHSNSSHNKSSNSNSTTTSLHGNNTQTTTSATSLLLSGQAQRHPIPTSRPSILPITQTITKQPAPFSKDIPSSLLHDEIDQHHMNVIGGNAGDIINSITCPQCKRCRCEQCQSPRQLPSRWVCNKTCLCSAETVIDYASCLCCVKALFYHCAKDHEMECDDGDIISCADDPCSCLSHKRAARWGWLCALSVALPCLWCYWPMRGCVAICAKCYARHSRPGCQCQSIGSTTMLPISPLSRNNVNHSNSGITKSLGTINSGDNVTIDGTRHQHHHINTTGSNCNSNRQVIRTCDLTPEKRLLDSSPEY